MTTKSMDSRPNEETPLINGEASSSGHGRENGHFHVGRGSSTIVFLFNSKHTPGLDSENVVKRSAAYAWHIFKVTLLSSMLAQKYRIDDKISSPVCATQY